MNKIEDLLNSIESEDNEIRQNVILKYIKNWYWFVLFCLLGAAGGFVVYKLTPASYRVQSRLLIPTEDNAISALLPFDSPIMPKNQKIENQIGILQSFIVLLEIV